MSDDLVKRLRGFPPNVHETMTEAADRIAELEAALRGIIDYVEDTGRDYCEWYHDTKEMARAALEGGKS